MCKQSRQCINCRHFTRDFERQMNRQDLEDFELGYCMYSVPRTTNVEMKKETITDGFIVVPPLVYEDFVCSEFDRKMEE